MTGKGGFWKSRSRARSSSSRRGRARRVGRRRPPSIEAEPREHEKLLLAELSAARARRRVQRVRQRARTRRRPPPASASAPPVVRVEVVGQRRGRAAPRAPPLSELYQKAAKMRAVAHTAEQLLAILDGLAALPPEACPTSRCKAMDAADDRWTVADVLHRRARSRSRCWSKARRASSRSHGQAGRRQGAPPIEAARGRLGCWPRPRPTIQQQIAAAAGRARVSSGPTPRSSARRDRGQRLAAAREAVSREILVGCRAEIARLGRVSRLPGADRRRRPPGATPSPPPSR
jgi:hypothetical protein